jgi:hypothetical protein
MYLQSLLILKVEETEGSMVVVLALLYARGKFIIAAPCGSFCMMLFLVTQASF